MEKKINLDKITLGVCYYPEHWPASLWKDDLEKMRGYGIEVVRVPSSHGINSNLRKRILHMNSSMNF